MRDSCWWYYHCTKLIPLKIYSGYGTCIFPWSYCSLKWWTLYEQSKSYSVMQEHYTLELLWLHQSLYWAHIPDPVSFSWHLLLGNRAFPASVACLYWMIIERYVEFRVLPCGYPQCSPWWLHDTERHSSIRIINVDSVFLKFQPCLTSLKSDYCSPAQIKGVLQTNIVTIKQVLRSRA